MDGETSEDCSTSTSFYKKSFLQGVLSQRTVLLLLGNVLSHPSGCVLTSNDGHINVKFLPTTVNVLTGPMDKALILSMKKMLLGEPTQNFHKQ
jgi:hypothetical protein